VSISQAQSMTKLDGCTYEGSKSSSRHTQVNSKSMCACVQARYSECDLSLLVNSSQTMSLDLSCDLKSERGGKSSLSKYVF
jgi:hypothetical protein